MSSKIKKKEKKLKLRRESDQKRRIRMIVIFTAGILALIADIAFARMAYDNYKATPERQMGKIGAMASVFPFILLGMIIIVSVVILIKRYRKDNRRK